MYCCTPCRYEQSTRGIELDLVATELVPQRLHDVAVQGDGSSQNHSQLLASILVHCLLYTYTV